MTPLRTAVCGAACLAMLAGCVPHPLYRSGPVSAGEEAAGPDTLAAEPLLQPRDRPPAHPPPVVLLPEAAHPVDPAQISTANSYQVGVATYYARERHGRRTAGGARYNMYKMTAAHRVLPLGTLIKVTNLENGRWVVVEVNDRGPYTRRRILDVSYAAALELDMLGSGRAKVMIELVERTH